MSFNVSFINSDYQKGERFISKVVPCNPVKQHLVAIGSQEVAIDMGITSSITILNSSLTVGLIICTNVKVYSSNGM